MLCSVGWRCTWYLAHNAITWIDVPAAPLTEKAAIDLFSLSRANDPPHGGFDAALSLCMAPARALLYVHTTL